MVDQPKETWKRHTENNMGSWEAVVAHTFDLQYSGGRDKCISEFEASLVYRGSSRTAKATQRNPVSKQNNKNPT